MFGLVVPGLMTLRCLFAVGYKSRADEKSWNGANRKVLENEIAIHLAIFESIPHIYEIVEKLGVSTAISL